MTVLLDDQSNEPGTHVLLIGVGEYPFLKGGAAPEADRFARHMEMGQLSSPPLSVEALAKWFVDANAGFDNPQRPLRSLDMLCSGNAPLTWTHGGANKVVDRALTDAVVAAIPLWMERASRNPDNLAFFYFCGHGVAFDETKNALLLEDFGGNRNSPMAKALAFDQVRLGMMNQCAARNLCFFVDACRTQPTNAFVDEFGDDNVGVSPVSGGLSRRIREKIAPVFFATGLLSAAYGLRDQPSLFLQGMLRCFRGVGSRDADTHYEVVIEAIGEAINRCVESLAFQSQPQYCQPREAGFPLTIHRVRGDPEVIVKVFTRDQAQASNTRLSYKSPRMQQPGFRPAPSPWWLTVPLGQYEFKALADNDDVISQNSRTVAPPGAQVSL